MNLRTYLLTGCALIAFAANSLLCRLALRSELIDAGSFTSIRILSGALFLFALVAIKMRRLKCADGGSWVSAAMLFVYAAAFSFAYLKLSVGAGALILFGSVQVTMISYGIARGERPSAFEWLGLAAAAAGLAYLAQPSLETPSLTDFLLMSAAGLAWGGYSLRGRGVGDPTGATADNFLKAAPMSFLAILPLLGSMHMSPLGVVYAVMSGALTSGFGYVVWYAALPGLTANRAAIVQLCVPVLAGFAGVLLLSEALTLRLLVASLLTLGGVSIALFSKDWRPLPKRSAPTAQ